MLIMMMIFWSCVVADFEPRLLKNPPLDLSLAFFLRLSSDFLRLSRLWCSIHSATEDNLLIWNYCTFNKCTFYLLFFCFSPRLSNNLLCSYRWNLWAKIGNFQFFSLSFILLISITIIALDGLLLPHTVHGLPRYQTSNNLFWQCAIFTIDTILRLNTRWMFLFTL